MNETTLLDQPDVAWKPYAEPGLITTLGPLYFKHEEETFVLGLRVEERHCNPMRVCHGGTLMTFADVCLGASIIHARKLASPIVPTINLSIDFLAGIPLGGWIEGRARTLRTTRNLAFMDGLITSGEACVARVSALFKIA